MYGRRKEGTSLVEYIRKSTPLQSMERVGQGEGPAFQHV